MIKSQKSQEQMSKTFQKHKYFICVIYVCVYNFFHIVYINVEHKALVM
jgi:hypothetical protein